MRSFKPFFRKTDLVELILKFAMGTTILRVKYDYSYTILAGLV